MISSILDWDGASNHKLMVNQIGQGPGINSVVRHGIEDSSEVMPRSLWINEKRSKVSLVMNRVYKLAITIM